MTQKDGEQEHLLTLSNNIKNIKYGCLFSCLWTYCKNFQTTPRVLTKQCKAGNKHPYYCCLKTIFEKKNICYVYCVKAIWVISTTYYLEYDCRLCGHALSELSAIAAKFSKSKNSTSSDFGFMMIPLIFAAVAENPQHRTKPYKIS